MSKYLNYRKILADRSALPCEGEPEETWHAFFKHNNLPAAWQGHENFVITEFGFGTGLNFLATWKLWEETKPAEGRLHYIAFEQSPIAAEDLKCIHSRWPNLAPLSSQLIAKLPLPTIGFQRIPFENGVTLTLIIGVGDCHVARPFGTFAPRNDKKESSEGKQTVAIIGGGLAGCSAAYAFGRRGWDVTLIERDAQVALHASGNRAGVLMPHLSVQPDTRTRFSLAGFNFTRALLADKSFAATCGWNESGVLRLATSARLARVYENLADGAMDNLAISLSVESSSEVAGILVNERGVYFPRGGYLSPPKLCDTFVKAVNDRVKTIMHTEAISVTRSGSQWAIVGKDGNEIVKADAVVIANANDAVSLNELSWLPLEPVRGEVMHLPASTATENIRCPVCYDGYIIPAENGAHLVGATYEHGSASTSRSAAKQAELFKRLKNNLPGISKAPTEFLPGHVSFRASTPDRMPIVGLVPRLDTFAQDYTAVKYRNLNLDFESSMWFDGLYLSVGHGSQGLISCAISAELIAGLANGEPLPLDKELVDILNPVRFIARELNRQTGKPAAQCAAGF